jgi:hypothetical protein
LFIEVQPELPAFLTHWYAKKCRIAGTDECQKMQKLQNYSRVVLEMPTSGNMPFHGDTFRRITQKKTLIAILFIAIKPDE